MEELHSTPLAANLAAARQPATRRAYGLAWRRFCDAAGEEALPACPHFLAEYLSEIGESCRPATVRVAAAAIAAAHRDAGHASPVEHPGVRAALAGNERRHGAAQHQARGLTAEALAAIVLTAAVPRKTRGGRLESPAEAVKRAAKDIALIRVMRDALLRRGEAAALVWQDIEEWRDGTGRLTIRRSKTDPTGEGCIVFLTAETMQALARLRHPEQTPWHSVFGLSASQICRRINAACRVAALGEGFSGHSPRIGMAQDLAARGAELPSLMVAGRWKSPQMPARYTEREEAGRGAVARFFHAQHAQS